MRFHQSAHVILLHVLSAIVSAASARAADDDRIFDGLIEPTAKSAGKRMGLVRLQPVQVEMNLVQQQAAQLQAQRDHQLMVFLDKINTECSLTDEQMQKAKLAGRQDVRRYSRPAFRIYLNEPSPLFGTDFVTTDSMVYKLLMTQLTPEQKQKFEALRDKEMKAQIFKSLK